MRKQPTVAAAKPYAASLTIRLPYERSSLAGGAAKSVGFGFAQLAKGKNANHRLLRTVFGQPSKLNTPSSLQCPFLSVQSLYEAQVWFAPRLASARQPDSAPFRTRTVTAYTQSWQVKGLGEGLVAKLGCCGLGCASVGGFKWWIDPLDR